MTSDVEAVNRSHAVAVIDNGEEVEITNWLDDVGDQCAPDEAVVAIAGPDRAGRWYAVDLSAFEPVYLN